MPLSFIKCMFRIIATLPLAVSFLVPSPEAWAACITDWSIAAPIVHKEKLATVETLSRIAADELAGSSIVRTTLCEENGSFVYRILMRDDRGRLSARVVDARVPFGRR